MSEFGSILVHSPSWIGDAVMSLAALRRVRARYPAARITVLARSWAADLYSGCEAVDETIRYDHRGSHRGALGLMRLVRSLRQCRFDLAVLFPNAFRAAAVVWAAGIPERWGYGSDGRGLLLSRSVPPAPRPFGRHQAFYYLDLLHALEISGPVSGPPDHRLHLTETMRRKSADLLLARGHRAGQPLVGIHPGATNSSAKRWLPERYAGVADRLGARLGARVVLLGGPSEAGLASEIRLWMRSVPIVLAGETSLEELMGILGALSVLVTNDSGPMHVASALGVPTVAVFGPTDERETGPLGPESVVIRQHVDCSPCLLKRCPTDHRCMRGVEVGEVYDAAARLLGENAPARPAEAASR